MSRASFPGLNFRGRPLPRFATAGGAAVVVEAVGIGVGADVVGVVGVVIVAVVAPTSA